MLKKIFASLSQYAFLPLRLAVGLVLLLAGWPKVVDAGVFVHKVVDLGIPYGNILGWVAIATELLGGLLVLVGLLTRWAALAVCLEMAVALWYAHLPHDRFGSDPDFTLALVTGLAALTLFLGGPGKASVDSFRGKL